MREQSFHAAPATKNCQSIFSRHRHLLIGISAFNSRFSDAYVAKLVGWASRTADAFDVLLSGDEAAYLLEATGTPPGRARAKARKAVGRNRRSVEDALRELGPNAGGAQIFTFADFAADASYRELKDEVTGLFQSDQCFHDACTEMSRQAISSRLRTVRSSTAEVSADQAEPAARYVLAELPFFLAAPDILGVDESLLVYHRPWELGDRIFAGEFPIKVQDNHGYLTLVEK